METYEIARLINEFTNKLVVERQCHHCQLITTFIAVHTFSDIDDEPYISKDYWRCLKCLKLYSEELEEVVEHENKG